MAHAAEFAEWLGMHAHAAVSQSADPAGVSDDVMRAINRDKVRQRFTAVITDALAEARDHR